MFERHRQRVVGTQQPVSWGDYFHDVKVRWWLLVAIISGIAGLVALAQQAPAN